MKITSQIMIQFYDDGNQLIQWTKLVDGQRDTKVQKLVRNESVKLIGSELLQLLGDTVFQGIVEYNPRGQDEQAWPKTLPIDGAPTNHDHGAFSGGDPNSDRDGQRRTDAVDAGQRDEENSSV